MNSSTKRSLPELITSWLKCGTSIILFGKELFPIVMFVVRHL